MSPSSPIAIIATIVATLGIIASLLLLLVTPPTVASAQASATWLLVTGAALITLAGVRDDR